MSSDHPSGQRGSGTAQDGAVAAAVYTGVYHRLRPECGGSGKFRTCPQLCGLGLRTVRVHRQIIFGSRETHSGIYRTGGSDGDVIVGTYDLAGTVQNVECSKNHLSAAFISE